MTEEVVMGEEAFHEVRIESDRGTVIVRGSYGHEETWLGLSSRRCCGDDPDVIVGLSPQAVLRLIAALADMTTVYDSDEEEGSDQ